MTTTPTPYQRQFDFADWEANHPAEPPPGAAINAELSAIAVVTEEIISRLTLLQRDDGAPLLLEIIQDMQARIAALEARP
jgi:hypothetical protein